ncbi:MAG: hypothetical protein DRO36_06885 [Candidatus Hecatellales archaeon]|nr:MAG: hypothetical protein DRO36_06885 [Candidatus Hecatellales archaeon]
MPGAYLWAYDPTNKKWVKVPCATDGTLKVEITNMNFWQLEDTPNEYTGQAGKGLRVKSTEDGLEFVALALDPHGNEAHDPDMLPLSTSDAINAYMSGNKWLGVATSGIVGLPKQSGCMVYLSTDQSIPSKTHVKVNFDAVVFDIQNEFDETTNYRFTATEGGRYLVAAKLAFIDVVDGNEYFVMIYKNGSKVYEEAFAAGGANAINPILTTVIELAAGDYVEFYAYQNSASTATLVAGSATTWGSIVKIA